MPVGSKFDSGSLLLTSWAEFKKYLDGTNARRSFSYVVEGSSTRVITDSVGGIALEIYLTGADQTDFNSNFASLAGRRPLQGLVLYDEDRNPVTITEDAGVYRAEISGKVTVVGASPPPSTNAFALFADSPLSTGDNTTSVVIPSGETFHLQTFRCGNEDPTKGALFEIIYNNGTQHIVARFYTNGATEEYGFADVTTARDGTVMVGNGSHTIQVRRAKFSGSNIAMDAVLRGYTV